MKNIVTVMKKELTRVLKDPRLIFALLLPGLMIFIMYSIIGGAMTGADRDAREAEYRIYAVNMPAIVEQILTSDELELNADIVKVDATANQIEGLIEDYSQMLLDKEIDVAIVFAPDFWADISSNQKPDMEILFNPTENTSAYAYEKVNSAIEILRSAILVGNNIDVEVFNKSVNAVYDEKAATAQGFSMLIPFLIISFLFSGCMALAPDSIAGEKERGTIATILMAPIKRSELAMGKIFSLSILACISAVSSFIGLLLSLPKLMGEGISITSLYGFFDFFLILLVLVSTVLLIIGVMSIISSFAKTVNEASMFIMPFMFLSMLIGISTMFSSSGAKNPALFLIPIYNSVHSLISILTFEVSIVNFLITIFINLACLAACIFALSKLFSNEKVMFSK